MVILVHLFKNTFAIGSRWIHTKIIWFSDRRDWEWVIQNLPYGNWTSGSWEKGFRKSWSVYAKTRSKWIESHYGFNRIPRDRMAYYQRRLAIQDTQFGPVESESNRNSERFECLEGHFWSLVKTSLSTRRSTLRMHYPKQLSRWIQHPDYPIILHVQGEGSEMVIWEADLR